jgi:hypothetical protein
MLRACAVMSADSSSGAAAGELLLHLLTERTDKTNCTEVQLLILRMASFQVRIQLQSCAVHQFGRQLFLD